MKLPKVLNGKQKMVTAMPGKELGEDSEKRTLPKGTVVEHNGRQWELTQPVEVTEK